MKYELALNIGFFVSVLGSGVYVVVKVMREKQARRRAMAAVYAQPRDAAPRSSRISIPMPEPYMRGHDGEA